MIIELKVNVKFNNIFARKVISNSNQVKKYIKV